MSDDAHERHGTAVAGTQAGKPLRSALKKKSSAPPSSAAVEAEAAASSTVMVIAKGSTNDGAPSTSTEDATASSSSSDSDAARIRRAAEEKAAQLHSSRAAARQWADWVMQVQIKLMGDDTSTAAANDAATKRAGVSEEKVQPAPATGGGAAVSASTLARARMVLSPAEFEEVLEERAAAHRCAWPGCASSLPQHLSSSASAQAASKKKYRLSLSSQTVYDVTESQRFCGQPCFLQAEMYKQSLSDEPFYMKTHVVGGGGQQQRQPAASSSDRGQRVVDAPSKVHDEIRAAEAAVADNDAAEPGAAATPAAAPAADPRQITQLHIVEKPVALPTKPPQPPSPDAAKAAALAVEGYRPHVADAKPKDLSAAATTYATSDAVAASAAPADTSAATPGVASSPAKASAAKAIPPVAPSVHFSDTSEAVALAASATAPASVVPAGPLSRAQFDALSEDERFELTQRMAEQERARLAGQKESPPTTTSSAVAAAPLLNTAAAGIAVSDAAPQPPEQKIKRRKSAAEKAAAATAPNKAASPVASSASAASPLPASAVSPAASATLLFRPAGVAAATATSSSPAAPVAAASACPKRAPAAPSPSSRALMADDHDGRPIITPEEMRDNVRAVRGAVMPPFVQLLQAVLRWSTERTSNWLTTGRVAAAGPASDPQSRARQVAFLQFLQQHWAGVSSALALQRLDASRDLADLSNTLSFDAAPLPAFSAAQWRMLALVALRMVAQRRATEDKLLPSGTHRHSWKAVALFSALATDTPAPAPAADAAAAAANGGSSSACAACVASTSPAVLAAAQKLLAGAGFVLEQADSLFQTMADGGWVQ